MERTTPVQVGSLAPAFSLASLGGQFRLADERGRRNVLLYFMRSFDCPTCRGHAARLVAISAELASLQTAVAVIGPGDLAAARQLQSRITAPFPLLSDPDQQVYAAYGLGKPLQIIQQSGSFLVDTAGVLRFVNRVTVPTGSLREPALREALASLAALPRR